MERVPPESVRELMRIPASFCSRLIRLLLALLVMAAPLLGEQCLSPTEMDAQTKGALDQTAQQYFQMSQRGDYAGLKQNAIPLLAGSFNGVESTIANNTDNLKSAQASVRQEFVLDNTQVPGVNAQADFFCGIMNSPNFTGFQIPNLPSGKYALVIQDVSGGKTAMTLTTILQQAGAAWQLAGYYLKPAAIEGHDGNWYLQQAQQFQSKGDLYDAWLYYFEAWELLAPVDFMGNKQLDSVNNAMLQLRGQMPEIPSVNNPMALAVAGKTYKVTNLKPLEYNGQLNLLVKYQSADVSNTAQAFLDNKNVMTAVLSKWPQFRSNFAGIDALAIDPNGRDYSTLLAMKDVK